MSYLFSTIRFILAVFVFLIGTYSSFLTIAHAASTCTDTYTKDASVPTGYGAAFNLFSSAKELLMKTNSCTDTNASVTVGNGDAGTYVYKDGYYWTGAWQRLSFTGSSALVSNLWYTGSANASVPMTAGNTYRYYVGYTCQRVSSVWKCGCHDASCTTPAWQLQKANKTTTGSTCNNNNVCDSGETIASCPSDCGNNSGPVCGNGVCETGETSASCSQDCGSTSACGGQIVGQGAPLASMSGSCLVYRTYANQGETNAVNRLPDFSFAGYQQGGVQIPDNVPTKITLDPSGAGDDTARIQAAINSVSGMALDSNGFRGAVLLRAGQYRIANTIHIGTSGVVLRGEGQGTNGTVIKATAAKVYDAITAGSGGGWGETGTRQRITTPFVPVGSRTFDVASAAGFRVGDQIVVVRTPNTAWINAVDQTGVAHWAAGEFTIGHPRKIVAISGNRITIDIPIVDTIEDGYGGGYVAKSNVTGRIEHVGVEDIRLESYYASETDENHGHTAVSFFHVANSWVRRVTTAYFWWGGVNIQDESAWITVQDVAVLDPKSVVVGGRRYAFNVSGGNGILFQRCYARQSRHAFVTGARGTGPIVWLDCLDTNGAGEAIEGPHQRWSTGLLFDNIKGTNLFVEHRMGQNAPSAAEHGWAGAQNLFWNVQESTLVSDAPPGAMNWVIGGSGTKSQSTQSPGEPFGWWESLGTTLTPRSIYLQQLQDRLGASAVNNVTLPLQRTGRIWDALAAWAGNGRLEDFIH